MDENIGKLATIFRELGWNAVSAHEAGLKGHSDEDLFALGWREKRIVVTNDRHFLDDQRFPFHRCPGVLILPSPTGGMDGFAVALANALPVFKHYVHAFDREKVVVNSDGTWLIRGFSKERGTHWNLEMKMDGNGQLWERDDSVEA